MFRLNAFKPSYVTPHYSEGFHQDRRDPNRRGGGGGEYIYALTIFQDDIPVRNRSLSYTLP